MASLNLVTILGNLGKDPEVLSNTDKGLFVRLHVATTKKYRNDKNQKVEDTQWHKVNLNNGVAEFAAENIEKGDKVMIVGELRYNKWEDEEGNDRYNTVIQAKECKLISKAKAKEMSASESEE